MRVASLLLMFFAGPLIGACGSTLQPISQPLPSPSKTIATTISERPKVAGEDVALSFDRGVWHIEGTLTMPERTENAPIPAIVIVHGSGPMSRDGVMPGQIGLGFGFDFPVYKKLAEGLARRGFAVYRYDKRTCGQFNGCSDKGFTSIPFEMLESAFSTKEYVGDAVAAMDAVQKMPQIDPDHTFFIGHSEGGELVPLLLSERPNVRAGVMLAPPFHTMTIVLEQQSERLRWAYTTIGDTTRALEESAELSDAAHSLELLENGTHLGGLILGQPPGLWASWLEIAKKAPGVARDIEQPLLILGGGYDFNVAVSEIDSWNQWLASAKQQHHKVQVFPCVTHALNCITQPDPARVRATDIGRDIDPGLLDAIVSFLQTH
ncbi:MAG TPA: alpha/beta fold hydrolase [Polyangium sp.]|nr:alpha/beta fold hydrolase [Polyangium sp.]